MKSFTIHLVHSQKKIQHHNECSLLEQLEKQGIHHEYQCRSGYCGSCRVIMRKGAVSYRSSPLAFTRPNEILLCCCQVEQDLELEL